ncbi:hypothetical protein [Alteribacillus bidgolensis]|uniref:hypothetical protein n=1 Tax=Alteribacillus bidgolensis TaxID=930129 RepID=UPI00114473D0|nr:hypothetical protein [Alteribacillus bidgolensis]
MNDLRLSTSRPVTTPKLGHHCPLFLENWITNARAKEYTGVSSRWSVNDHDCETFEACFRRTTTFVG